MWPESLFTLWGRPVNLYLVFVALGALAALEIILHIGWERGISTGLCIAAWLVGFGALVLGGVVLPSWMQGVLPGQGHWSLSFLVCALLGEGSLILLQPKWRSLAPDLLDMLSPAVALGQSIGRLGCFAAGCCYGSPAPGLPWAVTLVGSSSAERYPGLPLHPVQLYEALGCLLIFLLLWSLRRRPGRRGKLLWLYLLSYGLLRFGLEFFRGDVRPMVGALSLNQVVCLGFVAIGAAMLVRQSGKPTHLTS
jgi:phosphatidylglycerol---prolipoprotein diacylglyceryl transferase